MKMRRDKRQKELELAIVRIERGRAKEPGCSLSISAVAREAGVSAALIHNCFPELATNIRARAGKLHNASKSSRTEINELKRRNQALLREVQEAQRKIAAIATQNELLIMRVEQMEAMDRKRVALISGHQGTV